MHLNRNDTVLFQGDSITDTGRPRDNVQPNQPEALGAGYARDACAMLLAGHPELNLQCHNRGISGNTVLDLAARWQADCLDLKPDVLSILIGVNDTWHGTGEHKPVTVTLEAYDATYRRLLDQTLQVNAQVRFVLCVPFVLRCGAVGDHWFPEFSGRQDIVRTIAADYGAVLVDFQEMFDALASRSEPAYWAGDGVHPSMAGHMAMAQRWCQAVGSPSSPS